MAVKFERGDREHCNVGTIGHVDHGKTTLTAAIMMHAGVGEDGKKVKETVTLPKHNFTRKFEIRVVKAGTLYGQWVAPANGALIARTG